MRIIALVQAHYTDWEGRKDISLKLYNNQTVIEHVIDKLKQMRNIQEIVISCPDDNNNLIFKKIATKKGIKCYFGSVNNVLDRLLKSAQSQKADVLVRVMGQHIFIDIKYLEKMVDCLVNGHYDFVQSPDNFWTRYCGEILTTETLIRANDNLKNLDPSKRNLYLARPIAFIKDNPQLFNIDIAFEIPRYSTSFLKTNREIFSKIKNPEYTIVKSTNVCAAGNITSYRYQFISNYFNKDDIILDIACGTGHGLSILSKRSELVIGGDLSKDALTNVMKANRPNVFISFQDASCMGFKINTFTKVVSIETIEHIPLDKIQDYLLEIKRILMPGGYFFCSTPQNIYGEIPIQPAHEKEYTLAEFKSLLTKHFTIEQIYGLRGGLYSKIQTGEGMLAICKNTKDENY